MKTSFLIDEWDDTAAIHRCHGYYDETEARDDFKKWIDDPNFRGAVCLFRWNETAAEYQPVIKIIRREERSK